MDNNIKFITILILLIIGLSEYTFYDDINNDFINLNSIKNNHNIMNSNSTNNTTIINHNFNLMSTIKKIDLNNITYNIFNLNDYKDKSIILFYNRIMKSNSATYIKYATVKKKLKNKIYILLLF